MMSQQPAIMAVVLIPGGAHASLQMRADFMQNA